MLKQIISLLFGLLFAEPSLSAHEAGLGLIRQGPAHPVSRLMAENPAAKTMDEPALETAASAVDQRGNTDSAIVEEGVEDDAPDAVDGVETAAEGKLSKSEARKQQECQMANAAMTAVGVTQNTSLQDYVRRVGQRLVDVAEVGEETFSFDVLETPQIQAATNACGNIFISTGLMMHLNSESELAAVLGHEIMHVLKAHDKRRKRRELLKGALGSATAMVLGGSSYSRNEINRSMRTATDL
ncbi:MAG TPA: hypothetical protein DCE20_09645, partial [Gammaproteobacteria bacterium]|nr:hypothetical protein [Gammaproteobacteria bacterium]